MTANQQTVLVVDDTPENIDILVGALKHAYNVKAAINGEMALKVVQANPPDIILLDIMMPGIDGLEVLKRIRRSYTASELPVIMATAKGDSEDIVTSLELGANDYVVKPLDIPVVLARVQTQLETCAQHKELKKRTEELEARTVDDFEKITPEQLKALIEGGESDRFELKSTMRWNLKSDKPGKEIETAWLKTVIAFLNSDGGILLIGVDDNGVVLGIGLDKFLNSDRYLLHVSSLLRERIGMELMKHIKFGLKGLEDKEILCVQCSPSAEAAFLKDNNDEDFYIRVGPCSRKLTSRETLTYIKSREEHALPAEE